MGLESKKIQLSMKKSRVLDLNTTFECEYYCTCTASTTLQGETYLQRPELKKKIIKTKKYQLKLLFGRTNCPPPRQPRTTYVFSLFFYTYIALKLRLTLRLPTSY